MTGEKPDRYVCAKCRKDLGRLARILLGDQYVGDPDFARFLAMHERMHWREEAALWEELREAAAALVRAHGAGAAQDGDHRRVADAVARLAAESD